MDTFDILLFIFALSKFVITFTSNEFCCGEETAHLLVFSPYVYCCQYDNLQNNQ